MPVSALIERLLKPGGKSGWRAVDAAADGLYGVSLAAPRAPDGKPCVLACAALPGAALSAESLATLAGKLGNGAAADWVVPLDRKAYSLLVVEEPSVRHEEMAQSVRWAISTMLDYPVADASVAWMRIPTEKLLPNRAPHVYAVATRNEDIEHLRQLFKQARLPLLAIDIQETAHRNLAARIARPGEGLVLLSVGKRGVQMTVTFQGELYLDRHVEEFFFAADTDAAALERSRERVVLQAQRSLDFIARTLPFIELGRIVLAPMPRETGLREQLAENLPLPVEPLDLSAIFDFSRVPHLRDAAAQADYFVALGSALRFDFGGAAK